MMRLQQDNTGDSNAHESERVAPRLQRQRVRTDGSQNCNKSNNNSNDRNKNNKDTFE